MGLANNINNSLRSVFLICFPLWLSSPPILLEKRINMLCDTPTANPRSEKGFYFQCNVLQLKKREKKKRKEKKGNVYGEGEGSIFLGLNWNKCISSNIATPCWDKDWSHILGFGSWLMLPGHIYVGPLQFIGIWDRPSGRVSNSCCPLEVVQLQCMT